MALLLGADVVAILGHCSCIYCDRFPDRRNYSRVCKGMLDILMHQMRADAKRCLPDFSRWCNLESDSLEKIVWQSLQSSMLARRFLFQEQCSTLILDVPVNAMQLVAHRDEPQSTDKWEALSKLVSMHSGEVVQLDDGTACLSTLDQLFVSLGWKYVATEVYRFYKLLTVLAVRKGTKRKHESLLHVPLDTEIEVRHRHKRRRLV